MYICTQNDCPQKASGKNAESKLVTREDNQFSPLYLLGCAHSICELCVIKSVDKTDTFVKCDKCNFSSNITDDLVKNVVEKQMSGSVEFTGFGRSCTVMKKLSEDNSESFPVDNYAFGDAYNDGLIQAAKAVEIIDIDLEPAEPSVSSRQQTRGAYLDIDEGDDNYVLEVPERLRLRAKPEFISVIRHATKAYTEHGQSLRAIRNEKIKLDAELAKLTTEAKENFHFLHSLLQIREKEVVKEISSRGDRRKQALVRLEENMANHRKSLKRFILKCSHVIAESDRSRLKQELLEAASQPCIFSAEVSQESDLRINFDDLTPKDVRFYGKFSKLAASYENAFKLQQLPDFAAQSSKAGSAGDGLTNGEGNSEESDQSEIVAQEEKPVTVQRLKEEVVTVSNIVSPVNFHVRLCSADETSSQMQQEIDTWCKSSFRHAPAIGNIESGDYCFAFSSQFSRWCRARFETYYCAEDKKARPASRNIAAATISINKNYVAQVLLIDYGATEEVYYYNIREKHDDLFETNRWPQQALKCSLHNIKPPHGGEEWPKIAIEKFKEFAMSHKLYMYVKEVVDGVYYCDLSHYDVKDVSSGQSSLIEILVFIGVAKFRLGESSVHRLTTNKIRTFPLYPQLDVGGNMTVMVVNIESPDLFYVNLSRHQTAAAALFDNLKIYNELPAEAYRLYCPKKNLPCVARFQSDDHFYRAIITDVSSNNAVIVQFVDFGNKERVPVHDLRLIKDEFLDLPQQAIPCCLVDIAPNHQYKWSENAIEKFKTLVAGELQDSGGMLSMMIYGFDSSHKASVVLHRYTGTEKSININAALVAEKFAKSTGNLSLSEEDRNKREQDVEMADVGELRASDLLRNMSEMNLSGYRILKEMTERIIKAKASKRDALIQVTVSSVLDPSEFYIQLASPEVLSYLRAVEQKLNVELNLECGYYRMFSEKLKDAPFEDGEVCAFKIVSENRKEVVWRRGRVVEKLKLEDPRIKEETRFSYKLSVIDYGGTRIAKRTEMAKLPPSCEFTKDGGFAVKCHLIGVQPAGGASWTNTALERLTLWLDQHKNNLHILVKTEIASQSQQVESVGVTLLAKETVIPGPLDPQKTLYYTCKNMLVGYGVALPVRRGRDEPPESDDETDLNTAPANLDVQPMEAPFAERQERTILSALKQNFHQTPDRRYEAILHYKEEQVPPGAKFRGCVTEIDTDLNIFFRIVVNDPQPINIINATITNAMKEKGSLPPFVGSYESRRACTAYFDFDKTWNRAEIVGVVSDKSQKTSLLNVYFVDYGNCEQVYTEQLSSEVFNIEIPKLALQAQLHNCKPYNDEVIKKLHGEMQSALVDKTLDFTWENLQVPMKISIDLGGDQGSLRDMLLNKDLIVEENDTFESLPLEVKNLMDAVSNSPYEANSLKFQPNIFYPVVVSHPLQCEYLYLQANQIAIPCCEEEDNINAQFSKFLDTIDRMRAETNTYRVLFDFRQGSECCVQYNDEEWYRGLVLKVLERERKAEVIYVDYGNTAQVEVDKIKQIPHVYVRSPPTNAFICRLYNVVPVNYGRWKGIHTDKIARALMEIENPLVAIFKNSEPPYDIDLFEADEKDPRMPKRHALQSLVDKGVFQFVDESLIQDVLSR